MNFYVIDKNTGKEADTQKIVLEEEWAKGLVYCDIDGFYIGECGDLILSDECGNYVYCDQDRFQLVWEDKK